MQSRTLDPTQLSQHDSQMLADFLNRSSTVEFKKDKEYGAPPYQIDA